MNPMLYRQPQLLKPITVGDNNGAASLIYNPAPLAYAPAAKKR